MAVVVTDADDLARTDGGEQCSRVENRQREHVGSRDEVVCVVERRFVGERLLGGSGQGEEAVDAVGFEHRAEPAVAGGHQTHRVTRPDARRRRRAAGQRLEVEVVAPEGALVDADALGLVVDAVQDQRVGPSERSAVVRAISELRMRRPPRCIGGCRRHRVGPASSIRPHTAIAAAELSRCSPLPSVRRQVPVGDLVGGQVGEEVVGAATRALQQRRVAGVGRWLRAKP